MENATATLISTKEVEAFMPNRTVNSSILDQQAENCAAETSVIADLRSNAEYIAQLTNQLYRLASAKKLETLAYILGNPRCYFVSWEID